MTTYTSRLRLALQALDENPDTWGTVLNTGVFELLEDAIAGALSLTITGANVTLTAVNGADGATEPRYMILNCSGTLTGNRAVIVPDSVTKLYLVVNNCAGEFTLTVRTNSGSGVVIPAGVAVWVYADGTNVVAPKALTAVTADSATSSTDATTLDGVSSAAYALLAGTVPFTRAQKTTRTALTSAATVDIDSSLSNAFSLTLLHNAALGLPTGTPADGQTMRIVIKQGAGGPYTLAYNAIFRFPGGNVPTVTASVGAVDYLSCEYYATDTIWLAALNKGFDN